MNASAKGYSTEEVLEKYISTAFDSGEVMMNYNCKMCS